ncbi:hypothetical protein HPP92_008175 [Vanilla planifolia]|uniref:Uncharacterized protein n=1 Tax=Vanilla planifolia TaxID=51239 RepID=A0A835RDZ1_VANPL|nr:hypothetical protein HPP92_008175 [Vanilla planifolia]
MMFSSELARHGGHSLFSLHRTSAGAAMAVASAANAIPNVIKAAVAAAIDLPLQSGVEKRTWVGWGLMGDGGFGGGGAGEENRRQALTEMAIVRFLAAKPCSGDI